MSADETWLKRDYPWPRMPFWFAGVAAFLALAGIVTTGFDSSCWFLTPPGVALAAYGLPWLAGHLGYRFAFIACGVLTALTAVSGVRWTLSEEIVLGIWILAGAVFMARRVRRFAKLRTASADGST